MVNKVNTRGANKIETAEFKVVKLDKIKSYEGVGQIKAIDKDGYFTTFTTNKKNQKTYKEYKQNIGSWKDKSYWNGTMSDYGCGITAIAVILSGYKKDYTPEDLRIKYYPKLEGNKMSEELSKTFKIKNTDFLYSNVSFTKNKIINHLKTNRPIIVCVRNKPRDNRWTTESHYMVLLATNGSNMVYVSNPNGLDNSYKSSGWYNINEIIPYLAKILYVESY